MFFLSMFLMGVIGVCVFNLCEKKLRGYYFGGVVTSWYIVGIAFTLLALGTPITISQHKTDKIKLTKFISNRKVLEKKYESIGNQLRYELTKYAKYETGVIDKIKPENVEMYFVKYPELRNVETVTLLATSLAQLETDIYNVDLQYNATVAHILGRQASRVWLASIYVPQFDVEFLE